MRGVFHNVLGAAAALTLVIGGAACSKSSGETRSAQTPTQSTPPTARGGGPRQPLDTKKMVPDNDLSDPELESDEIIKGQPDGEGEEKRDRNINDQRNR